MDPDQVAFRLMALYGKLRRATAPQVREVLKAEIDALVSKLGTEQRLTVEPRANDGNKDLPPAKRE